MTRRRRWLGLFRRSASESTSDRANDVEAEAQLWQSHQSAGKSAAEVVQAISQMSAVLVRGRTAVDALWDGARSAQGRCDELGLAAGRVADSLDRLRLVALNLGLEGSRLGEPAGRALMGVADEVRGQAEQGADELRELRALVDEMRPTMGNILERAEQLRAQEVEFTGQLSRIQTLGQEVGKHVEDVGKWAHKLSDVDPETAKVLARAVEHAKGLSEALVALRSAAQVEFAQNALRPVVEPLLRALSEMLVDAGEEQR